MVRTARRIAEQPSTKYSGYTCCVNRHSDPATDRPGNGVGQQRGEQDDEQQPAGRRPKRGNNSLPIALQRSTGPRNGLQSTYPWNLFSTGNVNRPQDGDIQRRNWMARQLVRQIFDGANG